MRWYTSAGSAGQLHDEAGHLTGVFSCCSGFAIYPNASFTCPDAASFAKRNFGGRNATFTVDYVISICPGCDEPGSGVPFDWSAAKAGIPAMVECADTGNITGFVIDWEPPARTCCRRAVGLRVPTFLPCASSPLASFLPPRSVALPAGVSLPPLLHAPLIDWLTCTTVTDKDKWSASKMAAAAVDFAQYSNELATALHARGRRLGLDLSGDQGSPIDNFEAFGTHAPAVDFFTMMSTYHYFDSVEKDGKTHYDDRLMVTRALAGGIPAAKLACGISSETVKFPNKTVWNASTFGAFEAWISGLGVGGLDVWRTDIDTTWPVDHTEPWFLAVLDKFMAAGGMHATVHKADDDTE